ncbi:hypothetical protein [Pectobacterium polaris]|uniref:hypothetical protein n=1 Tax=Pectobacterium polaris TaxID=2042057 RepID=UPI002175D8D1|nr:hypothetical protein [Pectobacterium polaris]
MFIFILSPLTERITGLDTVLTVYMLDRLELFGARHQQEDNAVLAMLQDGRTQADVRLQALLGSAPECA